MKQKPGIAPAAVENVQVLRGSSPHFPYRCAGRMQDEKCGPAAACHAPYWRQSHAVGDGVVPQIAQRSGTTRYARVCNGFCYDLPPAWDFEANQQKPTCRKLEAMRLALGVTYGYLFCERYDVEHIAFKVFRAS